MDSDLAALRTEVADLRAEVAGLRAAQAGHVCPQPQVTWYQATAGAAGGNLPAQVFWPANAQPMQFYGQTFAATACAAPVPQIQTFTVPA